MVEGEDGVAMEAITTLPVTAVIPPTTRGASASITIMVAATGVVAVEDIVVPSVWRMVGVQAAAEVDPESLAALTRSLPGLTLVQAPLGPMLRSPAVGRGAMRRGAMVALKVRVGISSVSSKSDIELNAKHTMVLKADTQLLRLRHRLHLALARTPLLHLRPFPPLSVHL